jgi:hypothetical protein
MFRVVSGLHASGLFLICQLSQAEEPASGETPKATGVGQAKTASEPALPAAVRVFMRADHQPLEFSARRAKNAESPTSCTAPCDVRLLPGEYQLRLNGVAVNDPLRLRNAGTLHGKLRSREASRESGWLALNVGGILGGVFVTVAVLGGPTWTYAAAGGSLAIGGVVFLVTYRTDRATVSFSPGEPLDVRGLPPPAPAENSSGPNVRLDRPGIGLQARSLGFRLSF